MEQAVEAPRWRRFWTCLGLVAVVAVGMHYWAEVSPTFGIMSYERYLEDGTELSLPEQAFIAVGNWWAAWWFLFHVAALCVFVVWGRRLRLAARRDRPHTAGPAPMEESR